MGYGHQRTADNLRHLAFGGTVINANNYPGIPESDRRVWEGLKRFYESVSAFKRIPLLGNLAFSLFDVFQKVPPFYPRRDLSSPSLSLRQNYFFFKRNWGKDLIERLSKNPLPLISTFFTPAFMAEFFGYPGEIFCVVCDTDIARTWVPLESGKSKIKYFAPTERVVERLRLYGVKPGNIFLTGYPLPKENTGSEKLEILKEDLKHRLLNLDPQRKFFKKYQSLIEEHLGSLPLKANHPLTLLFAIGGAGAQKEIAVRVLQSLAKNIKRGEIKLVLVAGIRKNIRDYFQEEIGRLKLGRELGRNIQILFSPTMNGYFQEFNLTLRQTDILWTKPSELSFYAALGIPLVIAPTVGSHEEFNKRWLLKSDFGVSQKNPGFTKEWFFDLINQGYLAEKAFEGFVEGEKLGVYNIQKLVFHG